jgi:hypothetical protein
VQRDVGDARRMDVLARTIARRAAAFALEGRRTDEAFPASLRSGGGTATPSNPSSSSRRDASSSAPDSSDPSTSASSAPTAPIRCVEGSDPPAPPPAATPPLRGHRAGTAPPEAGITSLDGTVTVEDLVDARAHRVELPAFGAAHVLFDDRAGCLFVGDGVDGTDGGEDRVERGSARRRWRRSRPSCRRAPREGEGRGS